MPALVRSISAHSTVKCWSPLSGPIGPSDRVCGLDPSLSFLAFLTASGSGAVASWHSSDKSNPPARAAFDSVLHS